MPPDGPRILEKLGTTVVTAASCHDGAQVRGKRKLIGAGCTLGVNAWVHYGVKMGDGAQLAADAFLIKGEEAPPHTRWEGNPASQVQNDEFAEVAMVAVTPPSATNPVTIGSGG